MLWLVDMGLVLLKEGNFDSCWKIERFSSNVMASKYGVSFTKGSKFRILVRK